MKFDALTFAFTQVCTGVASSTFMLHTHHHSSLKPLFSQAGILSPSNTSFLVPHPLSSWHSPLHFLSCGFDVFRQLM